MHDIEGVSQRKKGTHGAASTCRAPGMWAGTTTTTTDGREYKS